MFDVSAKFWEAAARRKNRNFEKKMILFSLSLRAATETLVQGFSRSPRKITRYSEHRQEILLCVKT
jgi:hypothetical protein